MGQSLHLAVNWADGMKISKQHFVETDNYHTDQLRQMQAISQSPVSYGLLSPLDEMESLDMQVFYEAGQQIRVKIDHCRAIAPDGSPIDVSTLNELHLNTSLIQTLQQYHLTTSQNQIFYIIISVNLFERESFGQPVENEMPIRHPYSLPAYKLSIAPTEVINAEQWGGPNLIVGKIEFVNGELHVVDQYIPACQTIKSDRRLREWYNRYGVMLNEIENYSFRIIQKINMKSQKNTLSDSVQALVERLINGLVTGTVSFQRLIPYEPPLKMIVLMIQLVQGIRTSLECLSEREKEELLNYLGEWADDSPGSIEKQIMTVLQVPYYHIEIVPTLRIIDGFFAMWTNLLGKLSQLEFIGKRKGQQVFIIESPVHDPPVQAEKQKSRWSPL